MLLLFFFFCPVTEGRGVDRTEGWHRTVQPARVQCGSSGHGLQIGPYFNGSTGNASSKAHKLEVPVHVHVHVHAK